MAEICTKSFVGWGFAPNPDTLVVFRGRTFKGRRGRERKRSEGEGREGLRVRKWGEKGGERGKGKSERRERKLGPPTFQMLPPPMRTSPRLQSGPRSISAVGSLHEKLTQTFRRAVPVLQCEKVRNLTSIFDPVAFDSSRPRFETDQHYVKVKKIAKHR